MIDANCPYFRCGALHRLALGLALASLVIAPAAAVHAAVRYVSPTGLDSNAGTISSPWSLNQANSSLAAGDVCYLLPGVYSGNIAPSNSGTSDAARITFVGNLADPSQVALGSIEVEGKSYITIKGVHLNTEISLGANRAGVAAAHDSVSGCSTDGGLYLFGAWYCAIVGNSIGNGSPTSKWNVGEANPRSSTETITAYCTISGNTFNLAALAQPHIVSFTHTQYCTISRNRVTMTLPAAASGVGARIMYYTRYCHFSDNLWQVRNEQTSGTCMHNLRDSTSFNVFLRDTLLELGPGPVTIMAATSGDYPGSVRGNRYDHCYVRMSLGGSWYYQDGMRQDTLVYCTVFNAVGPALTVNESELKGPILIDHNTFVGSNVPGVLIGSPRDHDLGGSVVITNNIFYNLDRSTEGRRSCGAVETGAYVPRENVPLQMDHNLYASYGYVNVPGDKAVGVSFNCDPGEYPVGSSSPLCTAYGRDCHSRFGSPMFVDSTLARFNPRLRAGSPAIGLGTGGTDVGAYPFGDGGPDVTPPGSVADLGAGRVSDTSLELTWTAPGDDGMTGTATAYDLRLSLSPIDESNFATATPFATQPLPLPAGSAQSYVVVDLSRGTVYYFALKARDAANNWSALSNVASATTLSFDVTPPAAIKDLTASP